MKMNRFLSLSGLAVLLASAGCGDGAPSKPADPAMAKVALADALESWKKGEPFDAPSSKNPPVRVADEDWKAGTKLVDYRIDGEGREVVGERSFPVALTLALAGKKPVVRRVEYRVSTDPVVVVSRQD